MSSTTSSSVAGSGGPFDQAFLQEQRQLLVQQRDRARAVERDLLTEVDEVGPDHPGDAELDDDAAQNGSVAMDRDWRMSQAEEERRRAMEAEAALARIDDGSYGRCDTCGGFVGRQRLQAEPATRRCLSCERLPRR